MAVNKINFTINSRRYTVVAEESTEYIEKLCNHINEKVENVLHGGQNVMGERPIVLAALNICDEYYKTLEKNEALNADLEAQKDRNRRLNKSAGALQDEIDMLQSGQMSIDEAAMEAEVKSAKDELDEANKQIKFLEGHIKNLENKIGEWQERYEKREKEFLEMIDEK